MTLNPRKIRRNFYAPRIKKRLSGTTLSTERRLNDGYWNRRHFRQAAESPCGHGVIYNALSFSSLTSEGFELLRGIILESWHGNKDLLKEFLASFALPEQLHDTQPINTLITNDDFVYGIKGWKESTSTSPSGRHLGHYKAMIQDYLLVDLEVKILNISLQRGIALQRWPNSTNVMIEKDPGVPAIHRLCIIHLFEADYNFILKLLWGSRLVHHASAHKLINSNQHGSQHRKTTIGKP